MRITQNYNVPVPPLIERRAEPRTRCEVPVIVEARRIRIATVLRDVSVSGAFVRFPGTLVEGQRLWLTLKPPTMRWPIVIGVEVRWLQHDSAGHPVGGGVRFDSMSAREMRGWARYVRSLARQFRQAAAVRAEGEYQEAHAAVLRLQREHQELGRQIAELASRPESTQDSKKWADWAVARCRQLEMEMGRVDSALVTGVRTAIRTACASARASEASAASEAETSGGSGGASDAAS